MEVITNAGIGWHVARTWTGGRTLERALKNRHEAPRLCPDCTPHPQPVHRAQTTATPDARPAAPPATPQPKADPYERGITQGRNFLSFFDGETADRIETEFARVTGPNRKDTELYRGLAETVAAEVARRRQAEAAEPEAEAGS